MKFPRSCFLLLLTAFLLAGKMQALPPALKIDSSRVEPVQITEDDEKSIFSDRAYVYKNDIRRGRNFIKDLWDWLTREKVPDEREREDRDNSDQYEPYDSSSGSRSFWDSDTVGNLLIFICIAAVLGGLAWLIFTGKFKKVFSPRPLETPFDFKEITEDIEGLNIDRLIEEAREKGDFRLATRWWYLKLLQQLTLSSHIAWKPYKTNFDYYRELEHTEYIQGFRQASHIYDYVWYGEMPVTEELYNKYAPVFSAFEKTIHA